MAAEHSLLDGEAAHCCGRKGLRVGSAVLRWQGRARIWFVLHCSKCRRDWTVGESSSALGMRRQMAPRFYLRLTPCSARDPPGSWPVDHGAPPLTLPPHEHRKAPTMTTKTEASYAGNSTPDPGPMGAEETALSIHEQRFAGAKEIQQKERHFLEGARIDYLVKHGWVASPPTPGKWQTFLVPAGRKGPPWSFAVNGLTIRIQLKSSEAVRLERAHQEEAHLGIDLATATKKELIDHIGPSWLSTREAFALPMVDSQVVKKAATNGLARLLRSELVNLVRLCACAPAGAVDVAP